ncbi:hypothetical protein DL770_002339 [Monosporascus sp. CRB-9-2]|nr:hypothetical protein DL770_002339 [Monosporascus sp. CRB-9-2]
MHRPTQDSATDGSTHRRPLEAEDVVEIWLDSVEFLSNHAQILTCVVTSDMAAPQTSVTFPADGRDFVRGVAPKQRPELDATQPSRKTWKAIAAQLALESPFISQPLARHTSYVHFWRVQQLVYPYVATGRLARPESASPAIVVGMIQDIVSSSSSGQCSIAPIAVGNSYPVCSSHNALAVIVNDNNGITTIAFLRFASIPVVPDAGKTEELREHRRGHGLGSVSFADLRAAPQTLRVRQSPALVTEEASFSTEVLVDGYRSILQPVHQCIFATDDLVMALPAKMQSYGRAKGFKAMLI